MYKIIILISPIMFVSLISEAHAYVGPGLGAGAIGVVLGLIGSIFIALFAILWYPLKRLLQKIKKRD